MQGNTTLKLRVVALKYSDSDMYKNIVTNNEQMPMLTTLEKNSNQLLTYVCIYNLFKYTYGL